MLGIKYTGQFKDPSGYGDANRVDVCSLFVAGVNLTTEVVTQTPYTSDFGILGKICDGLENRDINYKIKIIHLTSDIYPRYLEKDKYHIGRLFWETDKLPKGWTQNCNLMNEIWTATADMAQMLKKSGVRVPIFCFPQPILTTLAGEKITPMETQYRKDFTFYSIFQWIDRKNPKGLLVAYWKAFTGNNNVSLLLKTYRSNYDESEFDKIKDDIAYWKKELNLSHYPNTFLVKKMLTHEQMVRFHAMGDCYVNASSGEGFCRPIEEAMLLGKPVITGSNGGITDIVPDTFFYEVPSTLQKATEQQWIPYYTKEMKWKVLDEKGLIGKMHEVYNDYDKAKAVGKQAQKFVIKNFSLQVVGKAMKDRLEKINENL